MTLIKMLNNVFIYDNCSFKSLVYRRLIECGWMDQVTKLCKEKLKNRITKGQKLESVTEDELFNDIAPDSRSKYFNNNKNHWLITTNNNWLLLQEKYQIQSKKS